MIIIAKIINSVCKTEKKTEADMGSQENVEGNVSERCNVHLQQIQNKQNNCKKIYQYAGRRNTGNG